MTSIETTLLEAGQKLARAIGHIPGCPKASQAVPCMCGAGQQQAAALDEWIRAVKTIPEKST